MKTTKLIVVIFVAVLAALLLTASRPMLTVRVQGELSEGQLMIVGIVASAVLWILRLLASRGYKPSPRVISIALYVISFGLAIWFTPLTMPPFPPFTDAPTFVSALIEYIGQLLALASPVVGIAYLVYNVLLKSVLEWTQAWVTRTVMRMRG